jgi:homoserine kinase
MHRRRLVRVPASSANLGPGFDVLAAALGLHVELEVEETGRFAVHTDLQIARDRRNLAVRAFETLHPADDFEFTIRSQVPLSGGLGTSAAAYVAGLMAADSIFELDVALLPAATKLEGHPDNAAAAVFGGFTIVVDESVVARFDPDPELRPALFVPADIAISTEVARRALPDAVPREDAVSNAGHAALVAVALLHEPDLLHAAMRDRLHEDVRLGLVPEMRQVFDRLRAAGLAACVSGSGPTLLAFERHDVVTPEPAEGWRIVRVPVRAAGVDIRQD